MKRSILTYYLTALFSFALFLLTGFRVQGQNAGVVYVSNRTNAQLGVAEDAERDGSDWRHALEDLQTAIDIAARSGKQVWVQGFYDYDNPLNYYYPSTVITDEYGNVGTTRRWKSFIMRKGVQVYGGFHGFVLAGDSIYNSSGVLVKATANLEGETATSQRLRRTSEGVITTSDIAQPWRFIYSTNLSGDVDGGATGDIGASDLRTAGWKWNVTKSQWDCDYRMNSYHVVWFCVNGFYPVNATHRLPIARPLTESLEEDSLAILDGMNVLAGQANEGNTVNVNTAGAGVFLTQGGVVRNCVIAENFARFCGGGVEMNNGGTIENCFISRNASPGVQSILSKGGGVHILLRGKVNSVIIEDNTGGMGGGIYANSGRDNPNVPAQLLNYYKPWDITITNVTITNNVASKEAGGAYMDGGGVLSVATIANNVCQATTTDTQGHTGGLFVKYYGVVVNTALWGNVTDADSYCQFYSTGPGTGTHDRVYVSNCSMQEAPSSEWGTGTVITNNYNLNKYNKASDDPSGLSVGYDCPKFTTNRAYQLGVFHSNLAADIAGLNSHKAYIATSGNIYWRIDYNSYLLNKGCVRAEAPFVDAAGTIRATIPNYDTFGHAFVEPRPIGAYSGQVIPLVPVEVNDPSIRQLDTDGNAIAGSSTKVWALFVDPGAVVEGDGSSWENATSQIINAINALKEKRDATESLTSPSHYYVIYIKEGTIVPGIVPDIMKEYNAQVWNDLNRRGCTIPLLSRMVLRGSYKASTTGTTVDNSYRNPIDHPTIFSGDRGETGTATSFDDNLYHVVSAVDNSYPDPTTGRSFTSISGCKIVYGNAAGSEPYTTTTRGAGILAMDSIELLVHNCIIENNSAAQGAAVYGAPTSLVTIVASVVNNNSCIRKTEKSAIEVEGRTVVANSTVGHNEGGGIALQNENLIVNSVFFENSNGPFTIDSAKVNLSTLHVVWLYSAFFYSDPRYWSTTQHRYKPYLAEKNVLISNNTKENFTNGTGSLGCIKLGNDTRNGGEAVWEPCNNVTVMNLAINNGRSLAFVRNTLSSFIPEDVPLLSPRHILDTDLRFNDYNYGGAPDMGAVESTLLPRSGILYVSQNGAGTMDGSSWQNAIAGNLVYDVTTGQPVTKSGSNVATTNSLYTTLGSTYAEQSSYRFSLPFWQCTGNTNNGSRGGNVITNNRYQRYVSGLQYAVEKGSTTGKNTKVLQNVWVAAGTYTDIKGFVIRDSVNVYGGFPITSASTAEVNGSPSLTERHALLVTGIPPREEDASLTPSLYETILQVSSTAPVTWSYSGGYYTPTANSSLPASTRRQVLYQPDVCLPTWAPGTSGSNDNVSNGDRFPATDNSGSTIDNTYYVEYGGAKWDGFTLRHGYITDYTANRDGGAGVRIFRGVTLQNCVIRDNYNKGTRSRGGGVYVDGKTTTISNCYLLNNYVATSEAYGGGMYMIRGIGFNLAVVNNYSSTHGGGLFIEDATFYNNTVAFNYASGSGGGLYQWTGSTTNSALNVFNCLFYGNNGYAVGSSSPAYLNPFRNCFVQTATALPTNVADKITTANNNITGTGTALASPFADANAQSDNNLRITNSSLCFNAGLNSPNGVTLPSTDLDFSDRIKDCTIDIGAYESSNVNPITPTIIQWDRNGDGTPENVVVFYATEDGKGIATGKDWNNAVCECKLQELFNWVHYLRMGAYRTTPVTTFKAYASPSATTPTTYNLADYPYFEVWVAKGDYQPQHRFLEGYPRSYSWMIAPGFTVRGGFAGSSMDERPNTRDVKSNPTIFSGKISKISPNDASTYAYSVVQLGLGLDDNQNPDEIVKTNGSAWYKNLDAQVNRYGTATLNGITIAYGNADHPLFEDFQSGGGLTLFKSGRLENSIVHDCSAIAKGGGAYLNSGAVITGCVLRNNTAKYGGGLYMSDSTFLFSSTVVKNSTTSSGNGGGLFYTSNANLPMVRSSVLWQNESNNGKNIYGNVSGTQNGHVFQYTAVESAFPSGIGNLKLSIINDVANRSNNRTTFYPGFTAPDASDYTISVSSDLYRSGQYIYSTDRTVSPNPYYTETDMYNKNRFKEGNTTASLVERKTATVDGRFEMGAFSVEQIADPWPIEYNQNSDNVYRLYVSQNRKGSGNGHTWRNSMNDLQKALDYFANDTNFPNNPKRRCEIWMSQGTYQPTKLVTGVTHCDESEPYMASFILNPFTRIYGGFRGSNAFYYESVIEDYRYEKNHRLVVSTAGNTDVKFEATITVSPTDLSTCFLHLLASSGLTVSTVKLYKGTNLAYTIDCATDASWITKTVGSDSLFYSFPFYANGLHALDGAQINRAVITTTGAGWIGYASIDNRAAWDKLCTSITYTAPNTVAMTTKSYDTSEIFTGEEGTDERLHYDYNNNKLKEEWSYTYPTILDGTLSGSTSERNFHVLYYNTANYPSQTLHTYDTTYTAQRYQIGAAASSLSNGITYVVSTSPLTTSTTSATFLRLNGTTYTASAVGMSSGYLTQTNAASILLKTVSTGSGYSLQQLSSSSYLNYTYACENNRGTYTTTTTLSSQSNIAANSYTRSGSRGDYTFTTTGTEYLYNGTYLYATYYYNSSSTSTTPTTGFVALLQNGTTWTFGTRQTGTTVAGGTRLYFYPVTLQTVAALSTDPDATRVITTSSTTTTVNVSDSLVHIDGVTVQQGSATEAGGCNPMNRRGGGLWSNGKVCLTGCKFIENEAILGGGAIYSEGPLLMIGASDISGNGAIGDNNYVKTTPAYAVTGRGGALYARADVTKGRNATKVDIVNSLFTNNEAANEGSAIYGGDSVSLYVLNCTLTRNLWTNEPSTDDGGTGLGDDGKTAYKAVVYSNNYDHTLYDSNSTIPASAIGNYLVNTVLWGNNNQTRTSFKFEQLNLKPEPWHVYTSAADVPITTNYRSVSLSRQNDNIIGPRFGNPSALSGRAGYTSELDYSLHSKCVLVNSGTTDGARGLTKLYRTKLSTLYGPFNSLEQLDTTATLFYTGNPIDSLKGYYYTQNLYSKHLAPNLLHGAWRISREVNNYFIYNDTQAGSNIPNTAVAAWKEGTIDIGCYEYQTAELKPFLGNIVYVTSDESVEDKEANDGSTWDKATSDINEAIRMLMTNANNKNKYIKVASGHYSPSDPAKGYCFAITNPKEALDTVHSVARPIITSLTIRGAYPATVIGNDTIMERYSNLKETPTIIQGFRQNLSKHLFYVDVSMDSMNSLPGYSHKPGAVTPISFERLQLCYGNIAATGIPGKTTPDDGAAICALNTKTSIRQCRIYKNYNEDEAHVDLSRHAGAVYMRGGNINNSLFYDNSLWGLHNVVTHPDTVTNNTFALNSRGGILMNVDAIIPLIPVRAFFPNNLLWGNGPHSSYDAAKDEITFSSATLTNSDIIREQINFDNRDIIQDFFSVDSIFWKNILIWNSAFMGLDETAHDVPANIQDVTGKERFYVGFLSPHSNMRVISPNNKDLGYGPRFKNVAGDDYQLNPGVQLLNAGMQVTNNPKYMTQSPSMRALIGEQGKLIDTLPETADVSDYFYRHMYLPYRTGHYSTFNYTVNGDSQAAAEERNEAFYDGFDNARISADVIDIGAYEYPNIFYPNIYVAQNGIGHGSSWNDPTGDLKGAVLAAYYARNGNARGTVWVKEGNYSLDDYNTSSVDLVWKQGVSVFGGFAGYEKYLTSRPNVLERGTVISTINMAGHSLTTMADKCAAKDSLVWGVFDGFIFSDTFRKAHSSVPITLDKGFALTKCVVENMACDTAVIKLKDGALLYNTLVKGLTVPADKPWIAMTDSTPVAAVVTDELVYKNKISPNAIINVTLVQPSRTTFKSNLIADANSSSTTQRKGFVANTTGWQYPSYDLVYGTTLDNLSPYAVNYASDSLLRYQLNEIARYGNNNSGDYYQGEAVEYSYDTPGYWKRIVKGEGTADEATYYVPRIVRTQNPLQRVFSRHPLIDYVNDRDLMGNKRLFKQAYRSSALKSAPSFGCFEPIYVSRATTLSLDSLYMPVKGSMAYLDSAATLTLQRYSGRSFTFAPEYLLMRRGSQLLGDGNSVALEKISLEYVLKKGKWTLVSMPFNFVCTPGNWTTGVVAVSHNGGNHVRITPMTLGTIEGTESNGRMEIYGYDGAARAMARSKSYEDASPYWTALTGDTARATRGYLVRQASVDTLMRFSAMSRKYNQYVYTETAGSYKTLSLPQYNLIDRTGRAEFTYKENMGWNLVGNPFLAYYPFHSIELPHTYYLYNNDYQYYYPVRSWSTTDYALPGEALFTQTSTLKSAETLYLPQLTAAQAGTTRSSGEAQPSAVRMRIAPQGGEGGDYVTVQPHENEDSPLQFNMDEDALKWMGMDKSVPQIYAGNSDGVRFATTTSAPLEGETPVGFYTGNAGSYHISLDKGFGTDYDMVLLIDKKANRVRDLKEGDYTFTVAQGDEGDNTARFVLRFTRDGSLQPGDGGSDTGSKPVICQEREGTLTVKALETGDDVYVFDTKGKLWQRGRASGEVVEIVLPSQIYVVTVVRGDKRVANEKIRLR